MQKNRTSDDQADFDPITFGIQILFPIVFLGIPLFLIVLLYTTDLNRRIGSIMGVNLPENDSLIVYDAICTAPNRRPVLSIVFWSRESAPISVRYTSSKETPAIAMPAGIQTLELTLFDTLSCPQTITLHDSSRGYLAGTPVEVLP